MSYEKFDPNTIVEIEGVMHLLHGYVSGRLLFTHCITGEAFRCIQADGTRTLPSNEDYREMLRTGKIVLKRRRSIHPDPIRELKGQPEWTQDQVARLDPGAVRRAVICHMLDDANIAKGNQAIAQFLAEHWTADLIEKYGRHEQPRTIRRYYTYCGSPGARHPRDMMSLRGQDVTEVSADTPVEQLLWKCCLEGLKGGMNAADIRADLHLQIEMINEGSHPIVEKPEVPYETPSERTVRRRCESLECSSTLASIIEKQAKEQDWLGAGGPLTADFAMQRVIIDHTKLDAHVISPDLEMVLGRPWLSVAIDVKTRAIVAWLISFFEPSVWTLGEVLRRMVLPKRPPGAMAEQYPILVNLRGKPTEVIVDNAVEFRSHTMEAAARHAGFSVRFCPLKRPRYRAICERVIGTVNDQICRNLPGRTLTLQDARRWGYDAEEHAMVMLDELEAFANQVFANYNVEPHCGLKNRQPAMMFERDVARYGVNNFTEFESFQRDTMVIQEKAQLSPSGIRAFSGLRYHDINAVQDLLNDLAAFEPRRSKRADATATVDFRYNPMDISKIHVWNRVTHKYVELKCSEERYADGMPLFLHERIQTDARREGLAFNTEEQRLSARGRMIQGIRNCISPTAAAAARKRVAELMEIPRVRRMTGNIVHLFDAAEPQVSLDDFIANDRAALTCVDQEILSPRPAPKPSQSRRGLRRRREDAGHIEQLAPSSEAASPPRRKVARKGGYQ